MKKILEHFGFGTLIVITITLVLFIAALFTKGLTHDALLEAAVFLVSTKLIIMAYRSSKSSEEIKLKIDELNRKIDCLKDRK